MSAETEKSSPPPPPAPPEAWQPFTFGGVAAFARARWRRLFVAQAAAALLFAAATVWFLGHCYAPVITQEIQKMPKSAGLADAQLSGLPGITISGSKFLSIAIAADDSAELDQSADLLIALRGRHVEISSILSSALGSLEFDYPPPWTLDLSRSHLEPWWGAWRPVILAVAGLAAAVGLILLWTVLAWVYAPAAKLIAWFLDRRLSWSGAWRLACAALLPGAVLMALGLVLYGRQMVDVFGLGYFGAVHFLAGWVYLLAAPAFAPRSSSATANRNPFRP